MGKEMQSQRLLKVAPRVLVGVVFVWNITCVVQFVAAPELFAPAYQLEGPGAVAAMRGIGVAFAMWNVTYLWVLADPAKHRTVHAIMIVQQAVGLIGELFIWAELGAGQELLAHNILRFAAFDAAGMVFLITAWFVVGRRRG